jgi:3-(3-hydroxy-phenyl)propionate hydroxylase
MEDSVTVEHHDIAIVGYGPVGALLALELADADLRVVIFERSREPVVLPRAVGLDGESVRSFQRLGFGNLVAGICQPPREVDQVVFTNSRREPIFGATMSKVGEHGWRDVAFFDQPELEALLRELVAKDDRIDVLFGHEVKRIEQDENGVLVWSVDVDNGAEIQRSVSYLIGCDGASSFVREHLKIAWESLGYDQDWLVVDVIQGPDADLPLVTMQVCDPERLTTYVCVKDPNRRWEFQLLEGETREEMLRPEKIQELLDPWTARENYEIRRAAVYQFHAATADSWRVGRVFLAGDAAHQTPPFLGQGLNAGFRDAVNLGWKIPLVMSGCCDARLLESYQAERDAHAKDLVQWAVAIGQLMETLAAREAGRPDPYPADESSAYGQGRTAPPLRGGVLMVEQCRDGTVPVGAMLRQPSVRKAEGAVHRLDELLGSSFAVVARKASDLAMGSKAKQVLERLGGCSVCLEDLEIVEGELDRVFEKYSALILRPDRYIFGVVDDDWTLDRLLLELGAKMCLNDNDCASRR